MSSCGGVRPWPATRATAARSGRPGPGAEKRAIGVVRLGLSQRGIEQRMWGLVRLWVGVTLFFFTLSAVAVYFFSRKVTGPVKRLTEHAEKMGRGSLDETVPV